MSLSLLHAKESFSRLGWAGCTFGTSLWCGTFYVHDFVDSLLLFPSLSGTSFGFTAHAPTDLFEVLFRVLFFSTLCACLPTLICFFLEAAHPGLDQSETWTLHSFLFFFVFGFLFLLWVGKILLLSTISGLVFLYGVDQNHQDINTGLLPLLRGLGWIRFLTHTLSLGFFIFLLCVCLPFLLKKTGYTLIDGKSLRKLCALGTLGCLSLALPTPDVFLGLLGIWIGFLFLFEISLGFLLYTQIRQTVRKTFSFQESSLFIYFLYKWVSSFG